MLFLYRDGATSWDVRFGLQSDGDPIVYLVLVGDRSLWLSYALEGVGSTYHLYELRFDPTTHSADLFVDEIERLSNYGGFSIAVFWGAGSSADTGQVNYNLVRFEVASAQTVPEPDTAYLFGSGG